LPSEKINGLLIEKVIFFGRLIHLKIIRLQIIQTPTNANHSFQNTYLLYIISPLKCELCDFWNSNCPLES